MSFHYIQERNGPHEKYLRQNLQRLSFAGGAAGGAGCLEHQRWQCASDCAGDFAHSLQPAR